MRTVSLSLPRFGDFGAPVSRAAFFLFLSALIASCGPSNEHHTMRDKPASELLGHPDYPAISYGGYRGVSRTEQPTLDQLKDDMRILHAMGIRFLRTYNVQLPHAGNVVQALSLIHI